MDRSRRIFYHVGNDESDIDIDVNNECNNQHLIHSRIVKAFNDDPECNTDKHRHYNGDDTNNNEEQLSSILNIYHPQQHGSTTSQIPIPVHYPPRRRRRRRLNHHCQYQNRNHSRLYSCIRKCPLLLLPLLLLMVIPLSSNAMTSTILLSASTSAEKIEGEYRITSTMVSETMSSYAVLFSSYVNEWWEQSNMKATGDAIISWYVGEDDGDHGDVATVHEKDDDKLPIISSGRVTDDNDGVGNGHVNGIDNGIVNSDVDGNMDESTHVKEEINSVNDYSLDTPNTIVHEENREKRKKKEKKKKKKEREEKRKEKEREEKIAEEEEMKKMKLLEEIPPPPPPVLRGAALGRSLLLAGDPTGAEAVCSSAASISVEDANAWTCLGEARLALHGILVRRMSGVCESSGTDGRHSHYLISAKDNLSKAFHLNPMEPSARAGLGLALLLLGSSHSSDIDPRDGDGNGGSKMGLDATNLAEAALHLKAALSMAKLKGYGGGSNSGKYDNDKKHKTSNEENNFFIATEYNLALAYLALGDTVSAVPLLENAAINIGQRIVNSIGVHIIDNDGVDDIDTIVNAEEKITSGEESVIYVEQPSAPLTNLLGALTVMATSTRKATSGISDNTNRLIIETGDIVSRKCEQWEALGGKGKGICAALINNFAVLREAGMLKGNNGEDYTTNQVDDDGYDLILKKRAASSYEAAVGLMQDTFDGVEEEDDGSIINKDGASFARINMAEVQLTLKEINIEQVKKISNEEEMALKEESEPDKLLGIEAIVDQDSSFTISGIQSSIRTHNISSSNTTVASTVMSIESTSLVTLDTPSASTDQPAVAVLAIDALEKAAKEAEPQASSIWLSLSRAKQVTGDSVGAVDAAVKALTCASNVEESSAAATVLENAAVSATTVSPIEANKNDADVNDNTSRNEIAGKTQDSIRIGKGSMYRDGKEDSTTQGRDDSTRTSEAEENTLRLQVEIINLRLKLLERGEVDGVNSIGNKAEGSDVGELFPRNAPEKVADDDETSIISTNVKALDKDETDDKSNNKDIDVELTIASEADNNNLEISDVDIYAIAKGSMLATVSTSLNDNEIENVTVELHSVVINETELIKGGENLKELLKEKDTEDEKDKKKEDGEGNKKNKDEEEELPIVVPPLYDPPRVEVEELIPIAKSYMKIADAYFAKNKFELAHKQFVKVLKRSPNHIPALLGLASSLEDYAQPRKMGEVAISYANATRAALQTGEINLAKVTLKRALKAFTKMPSDNVGMVTKNKNTYIGKDVTRRTVLDQLSSVAHDRAIAAEIRYEIGKDILKSENSTGEAKEQFRIASAIMQASGIKSGDIGNVDDKSNAQVLFHTGSELMLGKLTLDWNGNINKSIGGNARKALLHLSRALEDNSWDHSDMRKECLVYSGYAKTKLGNRTGAVMDYREVIEELPGSEITGKAHYFLGLLLNEDGEVDSKISESHVELALNMGVDLTPKAIEILGKDNIAVMKSLSRMEWEEYQENLSKEQSSGGVLGGGSLVSSSTKPVFSSTSSTEPSKEKNDNADQGNEILNILEQGAASYDGKTVPNGDEVSAAE